MNRKDLYIAVARELGVNAEKARVIVNRIFDGILDILLRDKFVYLHDFGTLKVKVRKIREKNWNPRTMEIVPNVQKCRIRFRPERNLKKRIRELDLPDEQ